MSEALVVDEGAPIALDAAEAAYLRRILGGLVDIQGMEVTIARMVGHVRLPTGRTLRVRSPKAPAASILAWAAYADPRLTGLRAILGRVPLGGDEGDVAELLARLFVAQLEDAILRHGLLRRYRRSHTDTETVRGRIDFARLARQGANLARVPCEVWERSEATRLNRLFVATLDACVRDPVLRVVCGPALARLRHRMAAIEPGIDRALLKGPEELNRAEQPFAPILALAALLLRGLGLVEGSDHLGGGFVINLEELFERTVVKSLRENGIDVVAKSALPYGRATGDRERAGDSFEVDALCRGLAGGELLVDAKYKRHISSSNLHQMLAYASMTGSGRGVFAVPAGVVADRSAYLFKRADGGRVRIDVVELRTDSVDLAGWRRAAAEFVQRLMSAAPGTGAAA